MQLLLDAIYDKTSRVHRRVAYVNDKGESKVLNAVASCLRGNQALIEFEDITENVSIEIKRHDSSVIFVLLLIQLSTWVFISMLNNYSSISLNFLQMCILEYVYCTIFFICFKKFTSLEGKDVGFTLTNFHKSDIINTGLTVVALIGLILIKVLLRSKGYYAPDTPVLDWSRFTVNEAKYAIEVVYQEFLSRGVVHESLRRIIYSKYNEPIALCVSSLFFGALHLHGGLVYMFGASVLMFLFGLLYIKQKNLWSLCIPHYVLGVALVLLNF